MNVKNWVFKCKHFFMENNINVMLNTDNLSRNCINIVSERVWNLNYDKYYKWKTDLQRETARREEGGNKLRTYRTFKDSPFTETYVNELLPPRHRRAMAQFRTGVAPIRVETGRYDRGRLPVEQRVCFHCSQSVEDEIHVITQCPLYADLRTELYTLCQTIVFNFNTFSDKQKLIFILSDPSIARSTARILYNILERRQTLFYV
jgi:hypothetical protein